MKFDIQIAHSVNEVGEEAWDYLSGGRPFSSYKWHQFAEKVLENDIPVYVILSQNGEPIARGSFWVRWQEQLPVSSRIMRGFLDNLIRRWPLFICSTPLVDFPGLVLPDGPALRDNALNTIIHEAIDQASKYNASFIIFAYLQEAEAELAVWPRSFTKLQMAEPRTRMDIRWSDFDEYIQQLPKKVRESYRRNCRKAQALGIKIVCHKLDRPMSEDALDRAVNLIYNVENNYGSAYNPWAREILKNAYMINSSWFNAEIDGKLIGCGLLARDGRSRMMTLYGRDYNFDYAYLQLFYEVIAFSIKDGTKILSGGTGNYSFKKSMGFMINPLHYDVFMGVSPFFQGITSFAKFIPQK